MDIIISAPQSAGKTIAAQAILKHYFDVKHFDDIQDGALFDVEFVGDNASYLAQKLREGKPEAIIFDGVIGNPAEMLTAIDAVKRYRQTTGRPNTLALFVVQEETGAIVLTDKTRRMPTNEFRKPAYMETINEGALDKSQLCEANPRRSTAILLALWDECANWSFKPENEKHGHAEKMLRKLKELLPNIEAEPKPGEKVRELSHDQSCELHSFLLDLKRVQSEAV